MISFEATLQSIEQYENYLKTQTHEAYKSDGCPYGDSEQGFDRWRKELQEQLDWWNEDEDEPDYEISESDKNFISSFLNHPLPQLPPMRIENGKFAGFVDE